MSDYQHINNTLNPTNAVRRSETGNIMYVTLTGQTCGETYQGQIDNNGLLTVSGGSSIVVDTYNVTTDNITVDDAEAASQSDGSPAPTGYGPNPQNSCDDQNTASTGPAECATLYDSAASSFYNVPCNVDAAYYSASGTDTKPGISTFTIDSTTDQATFTGTQVCSGLDDHGQAISGQAKVNFLSATTYPDGNTATATPELSPTELVATGFVVAPLLYLMRRRRQKQRR